MKYCFNEPVAAKDIADLRQNVGWNRMEDAYSDSKMSSYAHIAVYHNDRLIGYIDSVSNGVTDAYIQDLMVHTEYQGARDRNGAYEPDAQLPEDTAHLYDLSGFRGKSAWLLPEIRLFRNAEWAVRDV